MDCFTRGIEKSTGDEERASRMKGGRQKETNSTAEGESKKESRRGEYVAAKFRPTRA